jgi:hypothetical protein
MMFLQRKRVQQVGSRGVRFMEVCWDCACQMAEDDGNSIIQAVQAIPGRCERHPNNHYAGTQKAGWNLEMTYNHTLIGASTSISGHDSDLALLDAGEKSWSGRYLKGTIFIYCIYFS